MRSRIWLASIDALLGLERRHEAARHLRAAVDHGAGERVITGERGLGLSRVVRLRPEGFGDLERGLAHVAAAVAEGLAVVGKAIGQRPAAVRIEGEEETVPAARGGRRARKSARARGLLQQEGANPTALKH